MKHEIVFAKRELRKSTDRVLKIEDQNYKNFWSPLIQKISDQIPLYENDEHCPYLDNTRKVLDSVSTQSETHKLIQKRENFMKVCKPLLGVSVSKYPHEEINTKCRMIKLHKPKLHSLWRQWVKLSILIYNKSLEILRKEQMSKFKLRDEIKSIFEDNINEIYMPNTAVEYSIFDAKLAFKQSKEAKDKIYKKTSYSIAIDGRSIRNGFIYKENTKRWLVKTYKRNNMVDIPIKKILDIKTSSVCRLVYKRLLGGFWLSVPIKIVKTNPRKRSIISLDPGVRSFMTFYDGQSSGEIGKNINIKLNRLNKQMDKLDKKIEDNSNKKQSLRRAKARIQRKKENIVNDLHNKTCNFLKRYAYIILPIFKVKGMIRALPKKVKRSMLDLSHCKFRQRLIQKTEETGSRILFCNEIMTSKTCTKCGTINENLGKSKVFKCEKCHVSLDRDVNGARNILLRALRGSSIFLI